MGQKLLWVWVLCTPVLSFANPLGGIMGRPVDNAKIELNYLPEIGSDESLKPNEERGNTLDGNVLVNVFKGEEWTWYVTGSGSQRDLAITGVTVGNNNVAIGRHLTRVNGGVGFKHTSLDESFTSLNVTYGSDSDRPFEDSRNNTINANGVYGFEPYDNSRWLFLLNYSNNRGFLDNIPLPAFAYMYKNSSGFMTILGPIIMLRWFEFPSYSASIFITPGSASLDGAIGIMGPIQIYSGLRFGIESYMHHNRIEKDNRLYLQQTRTVMGISSPIARWLMAKLGVGYAFDQFLYEGESLFSPQGIKTRISNDVFVEAKLSANF